MIVKDRITHDQALRGYAGFENITSEIIFSTSTTNNIMIKIAILSMFLTVMSMVYLFLYAIIHDVAMDMNLMEIIASWLKNMF